MGKVWEHLRAASKHWVWLMSGAVSVVLSLFQRIRGLGVPDWIFWTISAFCFFAAFHLAWLEKDKDLDATLGPAPEVVLEYECGVGNPLTLRNLRGSTAYHVQIEEIVAGRCTARFEEVSHLAEGASLQVLPNVRDRYINPDTDKGNALKHDFAYVLEVAYQTSGKDFNPVRVQIFVRYADRNGRQYRTPCEIEFDPFRTIARTTCEPPRPLMQSKNS